MEASYRLVKAAAGSQKLHWHTNASFASLHIDRFHCVCSSVALSEAIAIAKMSDVLTNNPMVIS